MANLKALYRPSLALLTDLYQLTMAYGYWKHGLAETKAIFNLTFRRCPFRGGYAVASGLETALDLLEDFRFEAADLSYLATVSGNDGRPIFEAAFLDYLGELRCQLDVDAIEEGTAVFPHEPLVRVRGPLLQGQILETALLNVVNFQTLIATKSARICRAAEGEPVLEFGLRRAQGIDGGLAASRAAYVGGAAATSNVLAGRLYGIPIKGTHAHSWVMAFQDEDAAFEAYAAAMPNNCVFLVDTYDTVEGVKKAVRVAKQLRERGHEMVGIRLDSGDMAKLSIAARRILDEAGFPNAKVVASNDLDEHRITALEAAGAQIDVWGVGTRLATAYDQPALGGVYKLAAIGGADGAWEPRIKLSEQAIKVSNPGCQQVRRWLDDTGSPIGDVIYDEHQGLDPSSRPATAAGHEDLLVPVLRAGQRCRANPVLGAIRARTLAQVERLPAQTTRLEAPEPYPMALDARLLATKERLIAAARQEDASCS